MDLDAYRGSAESFLGELEGAYYRHYAGLDERYEIGPIYGRHARLFERHAIESLRTMQAAAEGGSDAQRRLTMLLEFAVDGLIGQATNALDQELARREATLTVELDGEQVGFRQLAALEANEPDPDRRAAIDLARCEATEDALNPLHRDRIALQHSLAGELGYPSYRDLYATLKRVDFDALAEQTEAFTAATDDQYPRLLEPELRRTVGLGVDELRRSDLARLFRSTDADSAFPGERLVSSFLATLRGLGLDPDDQPGVVLDVEPRARKSPRAFCSPVRIPGEVYLVIAPIGGRDDYSAMFHEGGHTEHFAHVDPELAFEYRHLGDNAITESFAFLLEHVLEDPEWLTSTLGIEDPQPLIAHARAVRLIYLRRYAAKFAYERELHGADGALDGFASRYAELLGGNLGIPWPEQPYLADVDAGFYCTNYIRAWALERQVRTYLQERFGPRWFRAPEAGALLRELWSQGQRLAPEELLGELTGEPLRFDALLADVGL
jgi:hypothetical protein